MVLFLHILDQGGLLEVLPRYSLPYMLMWSIEVVCYCAVNCYGLISGYVGVHSRFSYSNILRTWLQVAFYTVGATLVLHCVMPDVVSKDLIKGAFFPVLTNKYWYYTAYFGMSFFIPAMNHLLKTFPKKQMTALLFCGAVLFSVIPTLTRTDLFHLKNGYCLLWLMYLYLIGGYLSLYSGELNISPFVCASGFLGSSAFTALHFFYPKYFGFLGSVYFLRYTSPTILLCGITLLVGLSQCKIRGIVRKVVGFVAPLSFGVYLLHAQGTVYSVFMKNKFAPLGELDSLSMLLRVAAVALFWFCFGILIDWIRQKVFQILKINSMCKRLTRFLDA